MSNGLKELSEEEYKIKVAENINSLRTALQEIEEFFKDPYNANIHSINESTIIKKSRRGRKAK